MRGLTEKEYQREMRKVNEHNRQIEYGMALSKAKKKYKKHIKIETSKLIALYLFALLNTIVVYAMVAMWRFGDLSYLGVLISDIAAQVLIYAIYCLKAYKSKRSEENLKFRREHLRGTISNVLQAGADSGEYVPVTKGSVETFSNTTDTSVG